MTLPLQGPLPHILSGSSVASFMSRIWTLSWVLKLVPCLGFPSQWGQPLAQCPRQNAWSSFISAHSFIHAGMQLWGATLCRILFWEYRQRKVWTHCRGAYILGERQIIIPPSRGHQVLQCVSLASPHSHQVTIISSPNHCNSLLITSCPYQFYPFPSAFQILLQTSDQPDLSKQNLTMSPFCWKIC